MRSQPAQCEDRGNDDECRGDSRDGDVEAASTALPKDCLAIGVCVVSVAPDGQVKSAVTLRAEDAVDSATAEDVFRDSVEKWHAACLRERNRGIIFVHL